MVTKAELYGLVATMRATLVEAQWAVGGLCPSCGTGAADHTRRCELATALDDSARMLAIDSRELCVTCQGQTEGPMEGPHNTQCPRATKPSQLVSAAR